MMNSNNVSQVQENVLKYYFSQNVMPFYTPDFKRVEIIQRYGPIPDRNKSIIPSRFYTAQLSNDLDYTLAKSKAATTGLYIYTPGSDNPPLHGRGFQTYKRGTRGMDKDMLAHKAPTVRLQPI